MPHPFTTAVNGTGAATATTRCPRPLRPLAESFRAFQSWFLRIEYDRCGIVSMLNEAHISGRRREMPLRVLLARMRHDGCAGISGKAELLTGIEGLSSCPVRRIVLLG